VRVFSGLLGSQNLLVCDPILERRLAVEKAHLGIETCETFDFSSVDAAVIATPAVTHFELARQALSAGLDVLVEKPMALTAKEAESLLQIADAEGRILMVDHLLEYHPAVAALKEQVCSGALGDLLHAASERLNLGVVRGAENALWSLAPHDISVILYLFDEEPTSVEAYGATFLQDAIPDVATVVMRFESGRFAQVRASWIDPVKTRRLSLIGREGMAVFDAEADDKLVLYDRRAVWQDGSWGTHAGEGRAVPFEQQEPLIVMTKAFLASIASRKPPRSDARDGLRVVRVLEAASQSMERHQPSPQGAPACEI
jgi:predicted dehydrogenase